MRCVSVCVCVRVCHNARIRPFKASLRHVVHPAMAKVAQNIAVIQACHRHLENAKSCTSGVIPKLHPLLQ